MNFIKDKAEVAYYDGSFRRNLEELCKKCILYFPENHEFQEFLDETSQVVFLKSEEALEENERVVLRTFYLNNDFPVA